MSANAAVTVVPRSATRAGGAAGGSALLPSRTSLYFDCFCALLCGDKIYLYHRRVDFKINECI